MIIYALTDSNGAWRYIGKTEKPLAQRLAEHTKLARRGVRRHVYNWIRSLAGTPGALEVERCGSPEELAAAEVEWIAEARRIGVRLTNATDGGEGARGLVRSDETRARMSSSAKARGIASGFYAMRAAVDPSRGARALWEGMSPSERESKMNSVRSAWSGRHNSSTRAALISNLRSSSVSEKRKAGQRTPEARERASIASKLQWARRKSASVL